MRENRVCHIVYGHRLHPNFSLAFAAWRHTHLRDRVRQSSRKHTRASTVRRYALLGNHALETAGALRLLPNRVLSEYLGRFQHDAFLGEYPLARSS